jgi:hypothetical protein
VRINELLEEEAVLDRRSEDDGQIESVAADDPAVGVQKLKINDE